jgi:hypothetical protein
MVYSIFRYLAGVQDWWEKLTGMEIGNWVCFYYGLTWLFTGSSSPHNTPVMKFLFSLQRNKNEVG